MPDELNIEELIARGKEHQEKQEALRASREVGEPGECDCGKDTPGPWADECYDCAAKTADVSGHADAQTFEAWWEENMAPQAVIVTRHSAMVEYLLEQNIIPPETQRVAVIEHASIGQIEGQVVYGNLPLHLAAEADRVIQIPLNLTQEMRGRELSVEEMREVAEPPRVFSVTRHRVEEEQWLN